MEDTDRDGSFETQKVFTENLNLVSGIQIGFGGVWVGAAPNLLFIPDADGNDVPDSEPRILLDGWGYEDTHETLNSFTWGPDGWLYGCHGVFTHSRVGKPGTPDRARVPLNAGIWRYHPTRHQFEVFAWGGSNPWGIDYNQYGDWFMECCVIPHLFHVIQGARYHRQAGQHFNPHIYEDLHTIADHLHYGDGSFASMRDGGRVDRELVNRTAASTSMVGGGRLRTVGWRSTWATRFPILFTATYSFTICTDIGLFARAVSWTARVTSAIIGPTWSARSTSLRGRER